MGILLFFGKRFPVSCIDQYSHEAYFYQNTVCILTLRNTNKEYKKEKLELIAELLTMISIFSLYSK